MSVQIKRLLPNGVCAHSLDVGDRLLDCNGQSLQGLTQSQCLNVLKAAGPRVALTLLRPLKQGEGARDAGGVSARVERGKDGAGAEKGRAERVALKRTGAETNGDDSRESVAGVTLADVSRADRKRGAEGGDSSAADIEAGTVQLQSGSSDSSKDGTVTRQLAADNELVSSSTDHPPDTMSNPFLDPPSDAEEDGALGEPQQQHKGKHAAASGLSKTNPFYQDMLAGPRNQSCVQHSNPESDTLIDFASGLNDNAQSDGAFAQNNLLDVNGGGLDGQHSSAAQTNGGVDLLGSNLTQFGESDVDIPPPMEFSDVENHALPEPEPSGAQTSPVTNIDDLLGVDFSATDGPPATELSEDGASDGGACAGTNGSDNGFDFLSDAEEARGEASPALLADISEEEPPELPPGPPPPVPDEPPPPIPDLAESVLSDGTDTEACATTSIFLPSENPTDNVTVVSVSSAETPAVDSLGSNSNSTVHITDITVSSPVSNVSAVNVTRPKPAPRVRDTNQESKTSPRTTLVTVGSASTPNVTQIKFNTGTSETFIGSTLPPNAFMPTSIGITKAIKSNSPRSQTARVEEEEEEEEEEITPMTVHRDLLGNKMAAPSPPKSLGRQANGPRTVDSEAKRDLQDVLAQMTKSTRKTLPVMRNASAGDAPAVSEDEIVPVKMTRKEAETAQEVLSKWVPVGASASPSSPSSAKKSGFQKAVGTVIDVRTKKVQLPSNSAFLTTMGITKTPKGKDADEEVEEEITPMAVHKDYLGNKHYAPSPPESRGKQSGLPKLDSTAKLDIAAVMSNMVTKSKGVKRSAAEGETGVAEDAVVATVLSRKQARVAMDTVSRWLRGDLDRQRSKPSPFQRLIGNVIDSAAKTDDDGVEKEPSRDQASQVVDEVDSSMSNSRPPHEVAGQPSQLSSAPPAPSSEPEPPACPEVTRPKPLLPPTIPKPYQAPQVSSKPTMAERRTLFEQPDQSQWTRSEPRPRVTPIEIGTKLFAAASTSAAEPKPVPSQRNVRAPAKISFLSPASSLTSKPLSKIGTLSVAHRGAVSSLSASKLPSKVEYGKVRTDEAPFLVEVLKGILGLGIKVKVNNEGHVEVTEVQRNSPVDKNGNVK